MKKYLPFAEVAAMLVALFVLGSDAECLTLFIISKVVALAVFVCCAFDLNLLTIKHK